MTRRTAIATLMLLSLLGAPAHAQSSRSLAIRRARVSEAYYRAVLSQRIRLALACQQQLNSAYARGLSPRLLYQGQTSSTRSSGTVPPGMPEQGHTPPEESGFSIVPHEPIPTPRDSSAAIRAAQNRITRQQYFDEPEMILEGKLGNASDRVLNTLLAELRTLPLDELALLGRHGRAAEVVTDFQLRHVQLAYLGGGVVLRASDATLMTPSWPKALRQPTFAAYLTKYEIAISHARRSAESTGKLTWQNEADLTDAVKTLKRQFDRVYTRARRTRSGHEYASYSQARRFLEALMAGVYAMEDDDVELLAPSFEFQGDTIGEFLQHVTSTGCKFAPPKRSDLPVYQHLYLAMREMLLDSSAESIEPSPSGQGFANVR